MRAFVEPDICIGCGLCTGIASDVFEMNGDGKAQAVTDTTSDNETAVQDAINSCPFAAIREEE